MRVSITGPHKITPGTPNKLKLYYTVHKAVYKKHKFINIHPYISPKIFGEGVPLVNEGVKNNQLNLVVDSLTQFENDVRIIYKLN